MLNTLGNANTFWVYAALNVLFILLTLWLVPETKHVSLEHIERNLMKVVNCAKSALTINLLRLPPIMEEATSAVIFSSLYPLPL